MRFIISFSVFRPRKTPKINEYWQKLGLKALTRTRYRSRHLSGDRNPAPEQPRSQSLSSNRPLRPHTVRWETLGTKLATGTSHAQPEVIIRSLYNRPRSIYQYSSMAPRLSGQNCKFFKFLLFVNSQKRLKYKETNTKYRSLTWKPRSHVRILIYRTWPIGGTLVFKNRSAMRTCVAYELPWSQRFFLPLRGSGSLILCREKSRKSSVTGVLNSPFFTYHWNPVDFPVCSFGYKNLIITRLVQVWILKKIVGEAWQIAGE